jgi:hypothetical protein
MFFGNIPLWWGGGQIGDLGQIKSTKDLNRYAISNFMEYGSSASLASVSGPRNNQLSARNTEKNRRRNGVPE